MECVFLVDDIADRRRADTVACNIEPLVGASGLGRNGCRRAGSSGNIDTFDDSSINTSYNDGVSGVTEILYEGYDDRFGEGVGKAINSAQLTINNEGENLAVAKRELNQLFVILRNPTARHSELDSESRDCGSSPQ